MSKRYDVLLRLLLVGDTGVGKTCLICRYAQDEFNETHITTIGVDFKMKTADIAGKKVKMQIWDTAGQERFEAITKQFYRRAQGVVLVFDICSRSSFESLAKWLLFVKQLSQPDTCVVVVGNKCDRDDLRQVPTAVAQKFAEENGLKYFETSAKYPANLDLPFHELCKEIFRTEENGEESISQNHTPAVSPRKVATLDLTKASSVQRQDSSDTQMEKGERAVQQQREWCCVVS